MSGLSESASTCGVEINGVSQNITLENIEMSQIIPPSWSVMGTSKNGRYCNILTLTDNQFITINNYAIHHQTAGIIAQPLITSKNNIQITI